MSKPRLKPDLDIETAEETLIQSVCEFYGRKYEEANARTGRPKKGEKACDRPPSIRETALEFKLSPQKVRKILITGGLYSSEKSKEIKRLRGNGLSVEEIAKKFNMTKSNAISYLPHEGVYNLSETSVDADRAKRYREREKAVRELVKSVEDEEEWLDAWRERLWNCVVLYQGIKFKTTGRGKNHAGAVEFSYELKVSSRTGELTDELVFSNRSKGKTITRSTVELAFKRAVEEQRKEGCVTGPRKLGDLFGKSQLYAMFLRWGVITDGLAKSGE